MGGASPVLWTRALVAAVLIAHGLDPTQTAQMLGLLPTVTRLPRRAHHRTSER